MVRLFSILRRALFLGLALASATAGAVVSQTYTFIDATAPTAVDRMFRDGVPSTCAAPGTPALFGSASTYSYQTQTLYNNGPARCVTVSVTTTCTGTNFIGVNAYSPTVTSATRTGPTWLGDAGFSPNPTQAFSFNAPANSPIVFWIDRSAAVGTVGLVNCDYTISSAELDPTNVPSGPLATVPTLSEWGLIILALLVAGFAAFTFRRRAL